MSGTITPIKTANAAHVIQGLVKEGAIQAHDGDTNYNLHELNGRAVVMVALATEAESVAQDAGYTLSIAGGAGNFTISVDYGGSVQTTPNQAWNVTTANLLAALKALSNVADTEVLVTGPNGGPWLISFTATAGNKAIPVTAAGTGGCTPTLTAVAGGDLARIASAKAELIATIA